MVPSATVEEVIRVAKLLRSKLEEVRVGGKHWKSTSFGRKVLLAFSSIMQGTSSAERGVR